MRVLYITTAFPRYAGDVISPWIVDVIKQLKKRGVECKVFTSSYKGLKNQKIYGIEVKRFRYFFKRWEDLTHDETVPDRLKRGMFYKILVLFYLIGGIIGIPRVHKNQSYDIVHVHWPFPHAIFGYIAKEIYNAKMISQFHGVELRWIKTKMPFFVPFIRWVIKKSDCIIANSTYTAREINSITKCDVAVIPFGITVRNNINYIKSNHRNNILFVGRLVERKGVEYLIKAVDRISKLADFSLTIIGDGSERENLQKLVESMKLQYCVTFKGKVSDAELEDCYRNCDIFVLPACIDSKGDTEGLGVVLLEAMSCKKPVIGTNSGGIPDIIKDGETGLLVPEKDSLSLADAIERLLKDEELAHRLAENGYKYVIENFNLPKIADKMLEVYSRVLETIYVKHKSPALLC